MYLSLKREVAEGCVPKIAVFNYATFQDTRTPLYKKWIRGFKTAAVQNSPNITSKLQYPYAEADTNDSLLIQHMSWDQLPSYFVFSQYSSIITLLNSFFDESNENEYKIYCQHLSVLTAKRILTFCAANHITCVFTGMDISATQLFDKLPSQTLTLPFNVDVNDTAYNCAPIDAYHPNIIAHKLYAQKLEAFLKSRLSL